jgi:prepilin-type N-terminal cleavage/methylation domain-containing protein
VISKIKRKKEDKMKKIIANKQGFTLVELLIVVIILGILAAVAIPQFGSSTDDAKLSTLQSNLSSLRNATELYYVEHNSVYPGEVMETDGSAAAVGSCPQAFSMQLTRYSNPAGVTSNSSSAGAKGPYLKKVTIPANPFNQLNTVKCDITTNDITSVTTDNTTGWLFYTQTGRLVANDGAHDTE